MKTICFILPGQGKMPIGGFKVVYEYADGLAGVGYEVEVAHIAWNYNIASFAKGLAKYLWFFFRYKPTRWFCFKHKVKLSWRFLPANIRADYIVATAWNTAEMIKKYIKPYQIPLYLIQADESLFDEVRKNHWEERVRTTWAYPWKKMVIAEFLKREVAACEANVVLIPNSLDYERFHITKSISKRNPLSIAMLAHVFEWKGTRDGLAALEIARAAFPALKVTLFSTYPKMAYIPDWVTYRYNPAQDEIAAIYNEAAVFVSPSHTEGFGLPAAEAMASGCATALTDIPAYHDFTLEGETSLFSPVGDCEKMAANIIALLRDSTLRERLASRGAAYIREKLSFEKSLALFIEAIEGAA